MTFSKLLIANRGEIACRVISAAKSLGYPTVAVYSDADAGARHVQLADEAVCIGPAKASESYLKISNILDACQQTGADAVHPGYGFLSENADFSRACKEANITFVGPSASAIELMGSKRQSKIAMIDAGVPCVPGYQGSDQTDATLAKEAERIGLPLMIKASAGGGGRGMRVLDNLDDFTEQLRSARSESKNAFGDDELILERAVINARHVEIQIFGDTQGNVIHLNERDCSVQRRNQKVIEEAPSPAVDAVLRQQMGEAACNAAKACHYVGAGTVEFLLTPEKDFYFLEMNTRLQVEHPVTELTTGIDLVAWQLRIAQGEPIPLAQNDVPLHGHAMEVRFYAEDAARGFLPQTGTLFEWQPPEGDGVRVDHGLVKGAVISSHYDPMLAKVICYGDNRDEARRRLIAALTNTRVLGVGDNREFLSRLLEHPHFAAGQATTAFIKNQFADDPSLAVQPLPAKHWAIAAFCLLQHQPDTHTGWHSSMTLSKPLALRCQEEESAVTVNGGITHARIQVGDDTFTVERHSLGGNRLVLWLDGQRHSVDFYHQQTDLWLSIGVTSYHIEDLTYAPALGDDAASGRVTAPMDGNVLEVRKAQGDKVQKGDVLVVMEAMKMEHSLTADQDGTIGDVNVSAGDQVKGKQLLMQVEADETIASPA